MEFTADEVADLESWVQEAGLKNSRSHYASLKKFILGHFSKEAARNKKSKPKPTKKAPVKKTKKTEKTQKSSENSEKISEKPQKTEKTEKKVTFSIVSVTKKLGFPSTKYKVSTAKEAASKAHKGICRKNKQNENKLKNFTFEIRNDISKRTTKFSVKGGKIAD